jgi:hypothetical protein
VHFFVASRFNSSAWNDSEHKGIDIS